MKKLIGLTAGTALFLSLTMPALAAFNYARVRVSNSAVATTGGNGNIVDQNADAFMGSASNMSFANQTNETGDADAKAGVIVATNTDVSCGCGCGRCMNFNTADVKVRNGAVANTGLNGNGVSQGAMVLGGRASNMSFADQTNVSGDAYSAAGAIVLTNTQVSLD